MNDVYRVYPKKRLGIFSRFSVTFVLVALNVVFFILASVLLYFNLISLDVIAISPGHILEGNYLWTFITSMFMHGGLFHLFANMVSLFFIGTFVERLLGSKRYVWFYLLSGIFASFLFVLSALLSPSELGVFAVGASGAIFGLLGLLMLLVPNLPVYLMFIPIPIKMKYAAPGMLLLLWIISLGNIAHLGGFVAGIGYGLYLKAKYKNKTLMIRRQFS